MNHTLTAQMLLDFTAHLTEEERSPNTIAKYTRDVRYFYDFAEDYAEITKPIVIAYKNALTETYTITSANSMLAALNHFFKFLGWLDCVVKPFKVQPTTFRRADKNLTREDYLHLLDAAKQKNQLWLYYIMLTLCSTGIRVSELQFITVQALSTRQAIIRNKGKTRKVILPVDLCRRLMAYAKSKGIRSGSIFVTRSGKPIDRSNIFHAMKKLCHDANVEKTKVFPHNLRHLFAVSYYETHHDLSGLSCLLGHSNINTTRIYTMTPIEEKEQFVNDLGLVV